MIIDLQTDYISGGDLVEGQTSPLLAAFPELPVNVERLLAQARAAKTPIVHIRERDSEDTSKWLPYWDKLHPPGGVGAGSKCVAEPWAAELEGEPVFIKHCYDAFMSGAASEALLAHLEELVGPTLNARFTFVGPPSRWRTPIADALASTWTVLQ